MLSTACDNFLTGPGIDQNPNGTTGIVQTWPALHLDPGAAVGAVRRSAGPEVMYMQQISGNGRQQVGYDRGFIAPPDIDTY